MSSSEEFSKTVDDLRQRLDRLEAARPSDADAAKALLSGALPRQRIHLAQEIAHTDRAAILGSVAVWAICMNAGIGGITDWRVAWGSGLTSLLLGLWRLYVRYVDNTITHLYPAIARYEDVLGIPPEDSSLLGLRLKFGSLELIREKIKSREIGTRKHLLFDWVALIVVSGMAAATLATGNAHTLTSCAFGAPFHPYALLVFNITSIALILYALNAFQTVNGGIRNIFRKRK